MASCPRVFRSSPNASQSDGFFHGQLGRGLPKSPVKPVERDAEDVRQASERASGDSGCAPLERGDMTTPLQARQLSSLGRRQAGMSPE